MTIQKRLFISNIMMLVIPVLLSAAISYTILFIFARHSPEPMEKAFPKAFEIMWQYQKSRDMDRLLAEAEQFNTEFGGHSVYMAVAYKDDFIFPANARTVISERETAMYAFFADEPSGTITINDTRLVIEKYGDYGIILMDKRGKLRRLSFGGTLATRVILVFTMMIALILLTNRILTRFITKRITNSLDILVKGVYELRDGNLQYRIRYRLKDEFAPVCDDFNEMADRLEELILQQRKDEMSRKELLAGISHDLRTPLTSIRAYVEGLLDGVAEDLPSQLRYLGIIRSKSEDIDQIVDKLFLFSKLDIGEYPFYHEKIDIAAELSEMVQSIGDEYANKGMSILLTDTVSDTFVYADPVQLRNALLNILENSFKYRDKEKVTIQVACYDTADTVTVWLTDDGPGVPEDSLEKLFDVFYRSDPSRQNPSKGSGLGLAITAKIMSRMGGVIRAENVPQGGLRMILELPKFVEGEGASEKHPDN